jgi:hypothetical protein
MEKEHVKAFNILRAIEQACVMQYNTRLELEGSTVGLKLSSTLIR